MGHSEMNTTFGHTATKSLIHVEAFLDSDSETFSYVVVDSLTNKAIVIDPVLDFDYKSGRTSTESAEKILTHLNQHGCQLEWVLETHAHADHLSAAPFLKAKTGAKIGIGEHIKEVQQTFKTIFNLEKSFLPNGAQFDRLFRDEETLTVGDMSIRIMHTPGHTPADLAYIINEKMAFVGDTLFMPDVGTARCDFPGGSAKTLYYSIQALLALSPQTELYVCHDYPTKDRGHEYCTTVEQQRKLNIHVHDGVSEAEFVARRESRDKTLSMPRLILPAIQLNIRAGDMPPAEDNGQIYLKIPLNML
ncbi:MBL fold metallo-hydrolase [Pseudoalteromonas xiamenensis]|uniref:MBL fold metallo-hydrolase n=1 Tax=Pseudoalteromonas xiamenensis TaxID=882626 RepID=UPI0027E499ED|nr:MBL fold metallo-hydrolase [Pseudoalteromonas xiamenensis]WMN60709.1 MBL fold metallo-hydrolase [Pseudoalteromonas xiamenensis]WMN60815.1 MBL fold metallo-hydrolase [Pseudoalteromonas xiamenensis]